jgi:hypothetical protein
MKASLWLAVKMTLALNRERGRRLAIMPLLIRGSSNLKQLGLTIVCVDRLNDTVPEHRHKFHDQSGS